MVFTDFVESQLSLASVVAVVLSNWVVSFSISGSGETDSSVASSIVANGETSVVAATVDFPLRKWEVVSFLVTAVLNLCAVADSATGAIVSPDAIVPFVSVCVFLEALSSVEKFGST